MPEDKDIYIRSVQQLSRDKAYKQACQVASFMNIHDFFGIEEFIVPLVFQDKYVIAEEFLNGSKRHQVELAVFLDNLIGKKSVMKEVQSIIEYLKIHNARINGLSYKPLSKLLSRIIKTFNLPSTTCPNLNQKRRKGFLRFLLQKRYEKKSIGSESWTEMVLETIGGDETLQVELIYKVAVFGDLKEALTWAERFRTPKKLWPVRLRKFARRKATQSTQEKNQDEKNWDLRSKHLEENWDEENWDLREASPAFKFHKLPLQESQVKLIDTTSRFERFILDLTNGISIVGIDTEWKPSFGFKECELALIQIATFHVVYILDVIALATAAPQIMWERLAKALFENPKLLKLGFAINADMIIVQETLRKLHGIETECEVGFLDLGVLWKILVNDYDFVFPFGSTSKTSESLNCLIEMCLGESLDKSDQLSNWENRPLRKSQILYAALDAYCLLEAYSVIVKECKSQSIPISDIVEDIVSRGKRRPRESKEGKDMS